MNYLKLHKILFAMRHPLESYRIRKAVMSKRPRLTPNEIRKLRFSNQILRELTAILAEMNLELKSGKLTVPVALCSSNDVIPVSIREEK